MTDERIEKIKSAVDAADHISADKKAEMLALLAHIKPTIAKVARTHPEDARKTAALSRLQRIKPLAKRKTRNSGRFWGD